MTGFVLRMAWRELRASWLRLLFFFLCVAVGVAALVAIRSVVQTVRRTLVAEARNLVAAHVAADHSIGQALLKRLIDDASAPTEIGLASGHEAVEGQRFRDAAAARLQHGNDRRSAARRLARSGASDCGSMS